ncbi:M28 family peptidase [Bernardetia sp. ABR2-2B]|uniref:M28 family metallopeptidase n=1 Tax=Bernardetia sp. ABR2-2B TaxID=3127472 RepID=UPI0030D30371
MNLLKIVQSLENKTDQKRFEFIIDFLTENEIKYQIHNYKTGKNIIIKTNENGETDKPYIGISSHFDVVPNSGGANDNATSIAVCLDILMKIKNELNRNPSFLENLDFDITVFIFDEEERQLLGSRAYVMEYGRQEIRKGKLIGLINLEMLGQGDKLALWNLENAINGSKNKETRKLLKTLEKTAKENGIFTKRFDKIVTNSADHVSFRHAKLQDAFTITSISQKDIDISYQYYEAQEKGESFFKLEEIISQAPIFEHYHKPSDVSEHLNERSMQRVSDLIWETLQNF